jgi:hypothetical protein
MERDMTTEIEPDLMLQAALSDIQTYGRRAAKAKHLETAREMADNGYPCMETLLRAVMVKFAEQDEILDEILSNEGSVLQPELAAQIFAVLELAKGLCGSLSVQAAPLDENIAKQVEVLLAAVAALEPQIVEAAVPVEDAEEIPEGETVEDAEDVEEVA